MSEQPIKTAGEIVIDSVIRAAAIEKAIVGQDQTIFVWASNGAEQIEAALAEAEHTLVPSHVLCELVQHLTDCQALLHDARGTDVPDTYNEARLACISKWRQQLAPGERGPIS